MSLKRTWTLIKNELLHGPKGAVIAISVITPLALALLVNLAFGTIFSQRPKVGVFDEGNSRLVSVLGGNGAIAFKVYRGEGDLRTASSGGAIDMGLVLPTDFDATVQAGTVKLKAYLWGESLAKSRAVIAAVLADSVHEVAGTAVPVTIETVPLGEAGLPWTDRLLPVVALMGVFFGGLMLPAASLINEKQRHTLEALNVTPATLGDIFSAKGVIGAVLAVVMGVLTMALSGGFGGSPWGMVLVLALGAVMAVEIGLVCGALVRDMNTLFALWKFGGILLFGPAIVYMFPQIPQWIGYFFPTFYVIRPTVDMAVSGKSFAAELLYVGILAGLVVLGALVVAGVIRRLSAQALRLNA